MGNIAAGHDLIKRTTGKDAFGLLLPLVTAEGGQKFGKSEGNAVWLSKELSSPYDLYQFLPDCRGFKLITLPWSRISPHMLFHILSCRQSRIAPHK